MYSDTKLPRARVCASGRTLRNQRKVASGQRPLILMERNTMVRRVCNHAACFRILVPSKALSGACPETRISRVRRSIFAAVASLATISGERRCRNGLGNLDCNSSSLVAHRQKASFVGSHNLRNWPWTKMVVRSV